MANNDSFGNSEITYPAAAQNRGPGQAMMPATPMAVPAMAGAMNMNQGGPEIIDGSFNQTWLINCLRRRWLMALLLGILAAAASAFFLMWLFPQSSTVTALVLVRESTDVMEKRKALSRQQLEVFQDNQAVKMKSQFVLGAALQKTDISHLDAVEDHEPDPITWLQDELRVSFFGETLQVSFTGEENGEEMEKIINAVIDSYETHVVNVDIRRFKELRSSMEEMHGQISKDLQKELDDYETLSEELGGPESASASTHLNMLLSDVRHIQTQLVKKKDQLVEYRIIRELAEHTATGTAAVEQAVAYEMEKDPMLANYEAEEFSVRQQIRALKSNAKRSSPEIKRLMKSLAALQQESATYRRETEAAIRESLKTQPNDQLAQINKEYRLRRGTTMNDIALLEKEYEEKVNAINSKGARSGTLAMMEQRINQLQEISSEMDYKLRTWNIQNQTSKKQTFHRLQPASAREDINAFQRILLASFGGIAAFCATCYGVALIEFRRRRLNGASDLDKGLGVRVLGVLPAISSGKAMAPGSLLAAQLSESIDNVRATLMHDSTTKKRQVILITSPASMEGTTTVASHLALSLTRAGRRTLLVDGDIRDPALHKLFGMPMEDGLCEVLRSEIDVADAVRPTNTEGLWLLSAGHCDMDAVHALATDQPQPIFQKLRDEFDFVIVDGAPVLGLSDSVSIGQHVDGAILTVLRDHSEVRKVHQAIEMLKSMGILLVGSVVNGIPLKADPRITKMFKNEKKQPRKIAKAAAAPVAAAATPPASPAQAEKEVPKTPADTATVDFNDFSADIKEEIDLDFDDLGIDED